MMVSFLRSVYVLASVSLIVEPENEFTASDDMLHLDHIAEKEYENKAIVLREEEFSGDGTRQKSFGH